MYVYILHVWPEALRSSQELPEAPRRSQKLPEAPRSSQKLPGAPRSSQKLTEALRNSQEPPGTPRSSGRIDQLTYIYIYICMYVCMYNPGAPKPSVFTRVGRLRVLPHTKEQKPSSNGFQGYVFMEVWAGSRFEVIMQ